MALAGWACRDADGVEKAELRQYLPPAPPQLPCPVSSPPTNKCAGGLVVLAAVVLAAVVLAAV